MRIGSIKTLQKGQEPVKLVYDLEEYFKTCQCFEPDEKNRKFGSISQPRAKLYMHAV
jgi:hypothetical protein